MHSLHDTTSKQIQSKNIRIQDNNSTVRKATYLPGFALLRRIFRKSNSSSQRKQLLDSNVNYEGKITLPDKTKFQEMQTFDETLKKSHTSCCSATLAIDRRSWEIQQKQYDNKMERNIYNNLEKREDYTWRYLSS